MSTPAPGAPLPPPTPPTPPTPTTVASSTAPSPELPDPPETASRRRRLPLVLGGAVVLAVAVVVLVVVVLGDDDGGDGSDGPAAAGPAALVLVDDAGVEVYDADGETVTATLDIGEGGFPTPIGGGLLVDQDRLDDGTLLVVDVAAGTVEDYRVPEGTSAVMPLGADLMVTWGSQLDVDPQVVDLATRDSDDVSELVDLDSKWSQPFADNDGDAVRLVSLDADELSTAILRSSGAADAWLVDGAVLDIHAGKALSVERTGDDAFELAMVTPEGDEGDRAEIDEYPVGGLITGASAALVVDTSGALLRFDADGGAVDRERDLDLGEISYAGSVGVDRLLVGGDGGTVLLDAEGTELGRWEAGADGARNWIAGGSRCMLLSNESGSPGPGAILVDLETGEDLVELTGTAFPRGDGCSFVASSADGDQVVVDGEEIDLGGGEVRVRAVDPVGGRALLVDTSGDDAVLTLVDLDGTVIKELGEGIWILVP